MTDAKDDLKELFKVDDGDDDDQNNRVSDIEVKLCKELYDQNKQLCCGGRESRHNLQKTFLQKGLGISKNFTKCTNHGTCNDCVSLVVDVEAEYEEIEEEHHTICIYDEKRNFCIGHLRKATGTVWIMSKTVDFGDWNRDSIHFDFLQESNVNTATVTSVEPYMNFGTPFWDYENEKWGLEKSPRCDICNKQCNSVLLSKTRDIKCNSVLDQEELPQTWKAFKYRQKMTINILGVPTMTRELTVRINEKEITIDLDSNRSCRDVAQRMGEKIRNTFYNIDVDRNEASLELTTTSSCELVASCVQSDFVDIQKEAFRKKNQIHTCYCGFCLQHWVDVMKGDKEWVKQFLNHNKGVIWPFSVDIDTEIGKWSNNAYMMQYKRSDFGWIRVISEDKYFQRHMQGLMDACKATIHINRHSKAESNVLDLKQQLQARCEASNDVAKGSAPAVVYWLALQSLNQLQMSDKTTLASLCGSIQTHIDQQSTPLDNPEAFRDNRIQALQKENEVLKKEVSKLKENLKVLRRPTKRRKATRSKHEILFNSDSSDGTSSDDSSEEEGEEEADENLGLPSYKV